MGPKRFRPRFTLRGGMILVAMVAVGFGAEGLRRRSVASSQRARFYGSLAEDPRTFVCGTGLASMGEAERRRSTELIGLRKRHYERLERKYLRAARLPWLAIGPDPAPPDGETWTFETTADDL